MRVGTANLNPAYGSAVEKIDVIERRRPHLVVFQEITTTEQRAALNDLIPRGYRVRFDRDGNAVAWRANVIEQPRGRWVDRVRTIPGLAKVTPNRWLNTRYLWHIPSGRVIRLRYNHAPSGYRPEHRRTSQQAWRMRMARRHWQIIGRRVGTWVKRNRSRDPDAREIGIIAGDFNAPLTDDTRPWYPGPVLRRWIKAYAVHSIDAVALLDSSPAVVTKTRAVPLPANDHRYVQANLWVTPSSRREPPRRVR